jgi:hypothetical protein
MKILATVFCEHDEDPLLDALNEVAERYGHELKVGVPADSPLGQWLKEHSDDRLEKENENAKI